MLRYIPATNHHQAMKKDWAVDTPTNTENPKCIMWSERTRLRLHAVWLHPYGILEQAKPQGWGEGVEPKGAATTGRGNIRILSMMVVIRRPCAGNSNTYGMNGVNRSFETLCPSAASPITTPSLFLMVVTNEHSRSHHMFLQLVTKWLYSIYFPEEITFRHKQWVFLLRWSQLLPLGASSFISRRMHGLGILLCSHPFNTVSLFVPSSNSSLTKWKANYIVWITWLKDHLRPLLLAKGHPGLCTSADGLESIPPPSAFWDQLHWPYLGAHEKYRLPGLPQTDNKDLPFHKMFEDSHSVLKLSCSYSLTKNLFLAIHTYSHQAIFNLICIEATCFLQHSYFIGLCDSELNDVTTITSTAGIYSFGSSSKLTIGKYNILPLFGTEISLLAARILHAVGYS